MIIVGRLGQRGQVGGLGHRQFVERLVEIVERGGGDAVGPEAEINLVEIEFENPVLLMARFDAESEDRL